MGSTDKESQSVRINGSSGSPCPDRQCTTLQANKENLSRFNPLVLLKPGTDAPLFIVHGGAGTVEELIPVGELVRSMRPIYGIQARGLDGTDPPFDSIAQMAHYYTDSIRHIQPCGPYLISGYSIGGVVAFEMARQLRAAGEKVALLALLDAYTHRQTWPPSCRIGVLCASIAYWVARATRVPVGETVAHYRRRLKEIFCARHRRYGKDFIPSDAADQKLTMFEQVITNSCYVAWSQYRPRFYPGKITFVKAGGNYRWPADPRKIWRNFAKELELHIVPGHHQEFVGRSAEHLARTISVCLEQTPRLDIAE
jgi:acetoacetyl-CoA synthetase